MSSLKTTIGVNSLPANPDLLDGGAYTVTDYGLEVLLNLLGTAITSELNELYQEIAGDNHNVVETAFPFDVTQFALLVEDDFPVLAVHSMGKKTEPVDLDSLAKTSEITIQYILGDVSFNEYRSLNGILTGVENVIHSVLLEGNHPDFDDGYSALYGKYSSAKYELLEVVSSQQGNMRGTDLIMPALQIKIRAVQLIERNPTPDGIVEITGMDIDIDLGITNQIEDFVEGQSDPEQ